MPTNTKVKQISRTVVEIKYDNISDGWEQWLLLRSDAHNDNKKNNWDLERSHLELIKKKRGLVIDAGDVFDLMNGKFDPRKNYDELVDAVKGEDYIDAVVRYVAERYTPYAESFGVIGMGNHENSILNRLGTNVTNSLVSKLNDINREKQSEHRVFGGGYSGWVVFRFVIQKTVKRALFLKYYHGSGGAADVTRGVLDTNRMAVYLPDADIVLSGHSHNQWVVPIARDRISRHNGATFTDVQYHVRAGSYKGHGDGYSGWDIQQSKGAPKIQGACLMRLSLEDARRGIIGIEFTPQLANGTVAGQMT